MELDFNWVNILILFGAIQGAVFMGILLYYRNHPGRVFLALLMLALVYNAMETFNWSAQLDQYTVFFDFFPFVTIFLGGPAFYLYYKSHLLYGFQPSKKTLLLFFSPFLFQFFFAGINSLGYLAYLKLDWKGIEKPLTWMVWIYDFYSEIWSLLVFLFFTFMSLRLVCGQMKVLDASGAKAEIISWIKSLMAFQLLFAIGWTNTLLAPLWYNGQYGSHYYPIELFLVVFLYWITLAGYGKVKAIEFSAPIKPKETNPMAFQTLEMLHAVMDKDRLHLNPNLSLQMLADQLNISPKEISHALNKAGKTNFNDFVNNKRVEDFCERMVRENKSNLTIFGVAQECGFNSPATFHRAFKKAKNMSPKIFLAAKVQD
jgi:AraC-like DNA-binding protein